MIQLRHLVAALESGRIDLVVQKLTARSRTQVRGLFDHGCVSLNGVVCVDPNERVAEGDELSLAFDPHRNYKEKQVYRSPIFDLVYEDEWLLVIDKKAGYLTVPNERPEPNTVAAALTRYASLGKKREVPVSVVHRLDRDTSGLLVFARTDKVAQQIKSQFEARKPRREYAAIVAGVLTEVKGTFRSHLATDEDLNQYSTEDEGQGKLAVTHYEVKGAYADATFVRVTLETGRRNQIRVHFSEAGHPVLGDVRYEARKATHPRWKAKRLALHAAELGFAHPVTGREMLFRSKLPEEFAAFAVGAKGKS